MEWENIVSIVLGSISLVLLLMTVYLLERVYTVTKRK